MIPTVGIPSDNRQIISQENQQVGGVVSPWRLSVAPMMDWTQGLMTR